MVIYYSTKDVKEIPLDKINQDNVKIYDILVKSQGVMLCFSHSAYIDFFEEHDIRYELQSV